MAKVGIEGHTPTFGAAQIVVHSEKTHEFYSNDGCV